MADNYVSNDSLPMAPLKLAALGSCRELAIQVNDHIVEFRRSGIKELLRRKAGLNYRGYDVDSYLLKLAHLCFDTGETKGYVMESVRGADIFAIVDVTNYSAPYAVSGYINHMSLDDHSQDLKKIVRASVATAYQVNVTASLLYEERQHKRSKRESLDYATALEELTRMGVGNTITSNAHNPRVQGTIPLNGPDNLMLTYQSVEILFRYNTTLQIDKDHLMVISPGEGVMDRAVYLVNNLSMDMDMFHKRRDYSRVIDERSPIVAHEFLGSSVEGETILIIDNMIFSRKSMLDMAKGLKERRTSKVTIYCIFGLSTNGLTKLDEFYEKGYTDYVIATSLNYRPKELLTREWYLEADTSKYPAAIINSFNHDTSIGAALSSTIRIQELVQECHADGYGYSDMAY